MGSCGKEVTSEGIRSLTSRFLYAILTSTRGVVHHMQWSPQETCKVIFREPLGFGSRRLTPQGGSFLMGRGLRCMR